MPSYSNEGLHIAVRQLGPGSGEGQHTITRSNARRVYRSGSRRPIKRAGSGPSAYVLMSVRRRRRCILAEHCRQAAPMVTQFGRRLARSAPLAMEKLVHIKGRPALYHIIDRPGELVSQDGQRLALAVFFL